MFTTPWRGITRSFLSLLRPREPRGGCHRPALGRAPRLETLERRDLLAVVVAGLTNANELIRFDMATPGTLLSELTISGLAGGESMVALDLRPSDALLYGLGSFGNLYTVNRTTAAATFVAELTNGGNELELVGTEFGLDFNPQTGLLRLTSDFDINWRINATTGATTIDPTLLYAPSDPNEGADAGVSALAHTNNFFGAGTTQLFGIDSATDALVLHNPANSGTLVTVGDLGIEVSAVNGFEILPSGDLALAALTAAGVTSLYTIDLGTGAASLVGAINLSGASGIRGLSALPTDASPSGIAFGVNESGDLLEFDPADPTDILDSTAITGIARGASIVGIDIRPANGQLYALASDGTLYVINTVTGVATDVAELNNGSTNLSLSGSRFGIDFNPQTDRLRITSNTDLNWRVNVETGLVTVDTALDYFANDVNDGANPNVVALAYTSSTDLYGIDTDLDVLVLLDPENGGSLTTIGELGFNVTAVNGLDIRPEEDEALAALTTNVGTLLYRIDLTTGLATPLGEVGNGNSALVGLAFVSANAVTPGTVQFSAASYSVSEGAAGTVITVTRTGGSDGTITVDYTTSNGSATEGADYVISAGTLIFTDGETTKTFLVEILGDTAVEGNESINLTLSNVTGGGTLGSQDDARLTIIDNDGGNGGPEPPPRDNINFIKNLYDDVLDRAWDPGGLQFWMARMQLGATRDQVAASFFNSREYMTLFVNDVYQDFLGRTAEQGGLSYWVGLMQAGASESSVEQGILSSLEFFSLNGNTNAGYVEALYDRLLGRVPTSPELQQAVLRLQNGNVTRGALAGEVSGGREHLGLLIDNVDDLDTDGPSQAWYQDFLERNADAGGLEFYTNSLFRGSSRTSVRSAILASDEYFNKQLIDES